MPLTIELSAEALAWAAEHAAASGRDVSAYVSALVERVAENSRTLDVTLAPVRQAFVDSGMTEDELGDLLEDAKHAARAERRRAAVGHG